MGKLILLLYFLNAPMVQVEVLMEPKDCRVVLKQLADVKDIYKADGIDAVCLFLIPLSGKSKTA